MRRHLAEPSPSVNESSCQTCLLSSATKALPAACLLSARLDDSQRITTITKTSSQCALNEGQSERPCLAGDFYGGSSPMLATPARRPSHWHMRRQGVKVFRDTLVIGRHPGRCQERSLCSELRSPGTQREFPQFTAHSTFHISSPRRELLRCHPTALRSLRASVPSSSP